MPINPVHIALMDTGRVLVVSVSGNTVVLPDGRPFVIGGTVTDNEGLASQSAATRSATVSDFALSAHSSSPNLIPGGSADYTATITAANQFNDTVAVSVTGLPKGATATFLPDRVVRTGRQR